MKTINQRGVADFDTVIAVVWCGIAALAVCGAMTIWLAPGLHVGGLVCFARMVGACMLGGAALLARSVWRQL